MLNKHTKYLVHVLIFTEYTRDGPLLSIDTGFYYQNAILCGVEIKNSYLSFI